MRVGVPYKITRVGFEPEVLDTLVDLQGCGCMIQCTGDFYAIHGTGQHGVFVGHFVGDTLRIYAVESKVALFFQFITESGFYRIVDDFIYQRFGHGLGIGECLCQYVLDHFLIDLAGGHLEDVGLRFGGYTQIAEFAAILRFLDGLDDGVDRSVTTQRDDRGVRLLPDGRALEILIQTAGESTEQTDVLELIHDSWLDAGIKLYSIPSTREVFRNRIFSGDALMSIWAGLENALPSSDTSPRDLAPTSKYQYQWPQWGAWYESSGKSGEAPELPAARELVVLNDQWASARTREERIAIWHQILDINREQMFTIGIVNHVQHPLVVSNLLHNVPEKGFWGISPGSYFGIYKPDTFWFDEARR